MVVGEVATATQVLVIGGGPGGYAAAIRAAQLGRQVTLIERDRVGGTCLNVGCIPSKVFIHAADLANLPNTTAGTGISIEASVHLGELQDHMRSVVSGLTGGVDDLLAAAGVTVITGTARFSRPNRVAVVDGNNAQHIEFEEAILATGSRPIEIPSLPFSDERILDSTGALFGLKEIPQALAIVGGGYIGVELGTAWAKLGVSITIVEAEPALLPGLDPRLGRSVGRRLKELGIEVLLKTKAVAMTPEGLAVEDTTAADSKPVVPADYAVVCVGRRPNTDDLGLDVTDVTPDQAGLIPVDGARRAGKHILAIGDITAGPALAHKATAEADVAARTAAGLPAVFDPACIPAVVFSDPEVATVGLTAAEAKAAGITVNKSVFPIGASARARTLGDSAGQVELLSDEQGTLIGAHIAGPLASELIGEAALAIEMAATVEDLAATIHAHPTMSESLLEAAHGSLGMPLHMVQKR
ncbi:MAG: dihydrolipoyl dehydrogenase [Acidimicrobiales bacterium]